MFSLSYFEQQLVTYVTSEDKSTFATPFDISSIPVVTREQADAEERNKKLTATTPSLKPPPKAGPVKARPSTAEAAASASAAAQKYAEELPLLPGMREFGAVLKSSPAVELTEAETEYVVSVIKHMFKEHVVLQYEVKNTLPATVLEKVTVLVTPSDEDEFEELFIIEANRLTTDEPGTVYVAFKRASGEGSTTVATFSNTLRFTTKEIDPSTNKPEEFGFEDEYEVAEFDLLGSDYVVPTFASNFEHIWEQVGASGEEAEETLQLSSMKSIAGMLHGSVRQAAPTPHDNLGLTTAGRTNRGDGAADQDAVTTASGRHGCAHQPVDTHPQAAGQDDRWRQGRGQHSHGVLVQVGRHDQDRSAQRGERRCGIDSGKRGVKRKKNAGSFFCLVVLGAYMGAAVGGLPVGFSRLIHSNQPALVYFGHKL